MTDSTKQELFEEIQSSLPLSADEAQLHSERVEVYFDAARKPGNVEILLKQLADPELSDSDRDQVNEELRSTLDGLV
jgi:hypothetical protein